MSSWLLMPNPMRTKQFIMMTVTQNETKAVRTTDLTGSSIVAVERAPTHAVCTAMAPMICHFWCCSLAQRTTYIPPTS